MADAIAGRTLLSQVDSDKLRCVFNCLVGIDPVPPRKIWRVFRQIFAQAQQGQILHLRFQHDVNIQLPNRTKKRDRLERTVEVGMAGPHRSLQHPFQLSRFAVLSLQLPHFRARTRKMKLRPHTIGPRAQKLPQRRQQFQTLRIQTEKMLVIEDQPHTGLLMNGKHVGCTEARVVFSSASLRRTGSPRLFHVVTQRARASAESP